jgi:hypothetical protein
MADAYVLSELPAPPAGYSGTRDPSREKSAAISFSRPRSVKLFSRQTPPPGAVYPDLSPRCSTVNASQFQPGNPEWVFGFFSELPMDLLAQKPAQERPYNPAPRLKNACDRDLTRGEYSGIRKRDLVFLDSGSCSLTNASLAGMTVTRTFRSSITRRTRLRGSPRGGRSVRRFPRGSCP